LEEWTHGSVISTLFGNIRHFNVESYWSDIKHVFFQGISLSLKHKQEVVFFCDELVVFEVVDKLTAVQSRDCYSLLLILLSLEVTAECSVE
jgi:hypothetical protein